MDVEEIVGSLEFLHRERDALVPDADIFLVAGLQPNEFGAAGIAHRFIVLAQLVGRFVNPDQLRNRVAREGLAIEEVFPAIDYHPELRAPVADVVVANHVVPEKFRDPGEGVANRKAADVANMHRLGHVRRAKIDHDPLPLFGQRDPEPVVL